MKTTTKKKVIKKVKSVAKSAKKGTGVLLKKADKQAATVVKKANKQTSALVKELKKEWKASEPQREVYKKEFEVAAKKAGVKGKKMLKIGIKNSIKIGGDVADVIRKDIKEMRKTKS